MLYPLYKQTGNYLVYVQLFVFVCMGQTTKAQTVEYDLTVDYLTVNFTGKDVEAITINGGIPGPTLTFTEGDLAVIRIHNKLDVETSIHWHGLLLPNAQDGVPYLTTYPIEAGETHTFEFPLIQSGTYWYHSHTGLQEQRGVYGSIVIHPKDQNTQVDADKVLMLSDWTDENPQKVLRTLKRGSEWYSIKKGSVQSWDRVLANKAVGARIKQSFRRMPPMDISDVYYDRFLINGKDKYVLEDVGPGDRVRLRVINAGASTYFHAQVAGGSMELVAVDGLEVSPVNVDRILIASAETYDVIVTLPAEGSIEFRATAQDGSGYASVFLGDGEPVYAPDVPAPNPFNMDHMNMDGMDHMGMEEKRMGEAEVQEASGDETATVTADHSMHGMMGMSQSSEKEPAANGCDINRGMQSGLESEMHAAMGHEGHDMHGEDERIFDYSMLCAPEPTALPASNPLREVRLELTGNMERYVWAFNNKTLSEADKILIKRGENVRFVLVNRTMMHHPMHLHGHFFRVLNGQGDHAPLKHTVNVKPMGTTVIEFEANDGKDWFFHCHVLYHMMSGMARVVSYEGSEVDPKLAEFRRRQKKKSDHQWFFWGDASALSQANAATLLISNTRNGIGASWHADWKGGYEAEASYQRFVSRFLNLFVGGDFDDEENLAVAGVRYTLPFNLSSELRIDHTGGLRFQIRSGIDLTARTHFGWMIDTDEEWEIDLEYVLGRNVSLLGSYDSDYGAGLGMNYRF